VRYRLSRRANIDSGAFHEAVDDGFHQFRGSRFRCASRIPEVWHWSSRDKFWVCTAGGVSRITNVDTGAFHEADGHHHLSWMSSVSWKQISISRPRKIIIFFCIIKAPKSRRPLYVPAVALHCMCTCTRPSFHDHPPPPLRARHPHTSRSRCRAVTNSRPRSSRARNPMTNTALNHPRPAAVSVSREITSCHNS